MYIQAISARLADPSCRLRKPRGQLQHHAAGDVLIDMLTGMAGEVLGKVREIVREMGTDTYYRKIAATGSWVNRLVAMERLAFLKLPELRDFFRSSIAGTRDPEILARAVLGLSFIADEEEDLRVINTVLNDPLFRSSKFNEYIYNNIITSFSTKGLEERFVGFLEGLREDRGISLMLKKDIIEACGSHCFHPAKDAILAYYDTFREMAQMKITCIRALGRLGGEDVCAIIERSLSDKDWRVRAVSAGNAHLCSGQITARLKQALRDQNYYVRINSAVALLKFGDKGISVLREEEDSSDRFTRDVSRYFLKEARFRV
jgi:hypothetical protein